MYIEMDAKYLGTWFLQEFGEVLKKIYEMNRLHYKAEKAPKEEVDKLKTQVKEIEKEYDKAFHIGLKALETMKGTYCSFTINEEEKVFGITESKYPHDDIRHQTENKWVIKIHDEKMEPLMAQRLQADADATQ